MVDALLTKQMKEGYGEIEDKSMIYTDQIQILFIILNVSYLK